MVAPIQLSLSDAVRLSVMTSGALARSSSNPGTTQNVPRISSSKPLVTIREGPTDCIDEDKIKVGDYISVAIAGKIDESSKEGKKGFQFLDTLHYEFQVGKGEVIKGWDIGLLGLCKGAKATIIVPPDLVDVPEKDVIESHPIGATLNFNVEINEVMNEPSPQATPIRVEGNVMHVLYETIAYSIALYSKMVLISQPYQAKMMEFYAYNNYLETIVVESFYPFDLKYIHPLRVKIEKQGSALVEKISNSKVAKCIEASFKVLCTKLNRKITAMKKSSSSIEKNMPDFIILLLDVVEHDTATFVMAVFSIFIFCSAYRIRYLIRSVSISLICVIWYFCPLRLIIGR